MPLPAPPLGEGDAPVALAPGDAEGEPLGGGEVRGEREGEGDGDGEGDARVLRVKEPLPEGNTEARGETEETGEALA